MTDNIISREEFINLLDEIIEDEMQKPLNETDMEIVTACEHLINIFMGNEHEYTDEDAEKYFAEITRKHREKKNPFFIRSKRILAASVAVFIIFFGGIAFCAFNPTVKDMILKTLTLDLGSSMNEMGITFKYMGETIKYKTIEELISNEGLEILYPRELPDGVYIENIYTSDDKSITAIKYNDPNIGILITHNQEDPKLPSGEEYFINNQRYIISNNIEWYEAYTLFERDLYAIKSKSKESLISLIESIE